MFTIILILLLLVAMIGFPVLGMCFLAFGIENKYGEVDKQMFLEGSELPPAPVEEDRTDV